MLTERALVIKRDIAKMLTQISDHFISAVPSITISERRWLIGLGETAVIPCPAQGIPPPTIRWFKNAVDLSIMDFIEIKPNGDLHIMGVQDYDRGDYTCLATNAAGEDSEVVVLEVGGKC